MFDTIILLSSALEREIFMTVLSTHNPSLTIIPVESLADLNVLDPGTLACARLLAFVTSVIVPAHVLDQLGYGAYNFHPGPPAYPGWAPAHFALYQRAMKFGATAHVMIARVDEGPIVGVEMFSIPPGASVISLEGMAYARLSYLFWSLAKPLAISSKPLAWLPLNWSGKKNTRRDYAVMCDVAPDIPRDELDRRIKLFGDHHFGIAPAIHLDSVEVRVSHGSVGSGAARVPEPAADQCGDAHSSELGDDESRHARGRDACECVGKRSRDGHSRIGERC